MPRSFFSFYSMLYLTVIFTFILHGADSTTFTFKNNCPYTIWPGTLPGGSSAPLPQTGFQLDNGASIALAAPTGWSGRMWARTECAADASGRLVCKTGDCGSGDVACNGAGGAPPATLVEFTLNGDGGKDFYDVSLVDGFNLPVSVVPSSGGCPSTACPVDVNAACPAELRVPDGSGATVGCKSACEAFNTDQDCCRGAYGGPTSCPPSSYANDFKSACPQAYSYAYDDKTSTFTCATGPDYAITFCP